MSIRTFAQNLAKAFLNLAYPPLCLHCRGNLKENQSIFCDNCLALLELIDPKERCPHCFSIDYCQESRHCPACFHKKLLLTKLAAAFDYVGPAATLIKKMKYSNQPYLAEGAAAYLAAQFLELNWPMPDVIIPVPMAFTHWIDRGYNQSQLLAASLAKILGRPIQEALRRKSGDFSQAGLSRQQRLALDGKLIRLKKGQKLHDKTILLIDDVTTTGSTLNKCAEALIEDCPSAIYGLTVCRAIK